ncbi:hypothetical protein ACHAW5_010692 [Stephanodiscus triporus]|uniref:Uncharacterized protein n=1 Tax=Stephanodiscus triporus TaxID=2934178 RepID=A0ABD3NPU3_9STRA
MLMVLVIPFIIGVIVGVIDELAADISSPRMGGHIRAAHHRLATKAYSIMFSGSGSLDVPDIFALTKMEMIMGRIRVTDTSKNLRSVVAMPAPRKIDSEDGVPDIADKRNRRSWEVIRTSNTVSARDDISRHTADERNRRSLK